MEDEGSEKAQKLWRFCMLSCWTVLLSCVSVRADEWSFMQLEDAPNVAFEDMIVFSRFATSITLGKSEYRLEDTEFKESGLSVNRYGDKYYKVWISKSETLRSKLVTEGAAIFSGLGPYPAVYRNELLRLEAQARARKVGIWSTKRIYKAAEIEKRVLETEFALVAGQVTSVLRRKSGTYLNFGAQWQTDFTVLISPQTRAKFRKMSWKLEDLVNKSIRVRGLLRNYNGPFMEVFFPEQIEILEEGMIPSEETTE